MTEPHSTLADLLRWLATAWAAEIPIRLHVHETDDGGKPQWHAAFRAFLAALDTDREGDIMRPVRAHWRALAHSSGSGGRRARWLYVLACSGWDWRLACRRIGPIEMLGPWGDDLALDYATATLTEFHRRCQSEPRKFVRAPRGALARVGKSEAQHNAEEAA